MSGNAENRSNMWTLNLKFDFIRFNLKRLRDFDFLVCRNTKNGSKPQNLTPTNCCHDLSATETQYI